MSRRISTDGIYHIALVRLLNREVRVAVPAAVSLAGRLLAAEGGRLPVGQGLDLELDLTRFRHEIDSAIAEAVESLAPARRGRPPRLASAER
jgi:hypothetical protein